MRLQAQNSAIYVELIMPGTNQIAIINNDFRMDISILKKIKCLLDAPSCKPPYIVVFNFSRRPKNSSFSIFLFTLYWISGNTKTN